MACKYQYNNQWYSKEELVSKLSQENSNFKTLYQNLVNEITNTETGRKVLDRIKRDYVKKESYNKYDDLKPLTEAEKALGVKGRMFEVIPEKHYTLEEQQEEAIVELLGLMTAEKLDNVKDGKLISLLKRLLKEMKQVVRSLLNQKEVEIDKLPDNMTINDLSDLLAYSNSKLILPGYEVEYTTPDNEKFKTYQEASNHISELAKNVKDVDLDNFTPVNKWRVTGISWGYDSDGSIEQNGYINEEFNTKEEAEEYYNRMNNTKYTGELTINKANSLPQSFIDKNKEYEQSKEIIEEWKKVNNIQYNPEEIYSRGQEFSSVVGAYSNFDVNLMMQNLLSHIEDNEKAGGKFAISAYTKPVDRQIGHLEGGGGKIKFKIYPKSEDILWASNIDVYSGSVWDASEKVNKDKKSELLGVSYTKYPSLRNVNAVQPNLASIVDNLSHHHNELAIALTGNNFRLEYDEDIPYQTKKIIDGINKILDQKYGKLVKPDTSKKILKSEKVYEVRWKSSGNVIIRTTDLQKAKDNTDENSELIEINPIQQIGIQPTTTNETLKESIKSVKNNQLQRKTAYSVKEGNILRSEGWKSVGFNHELEEEYFEKPSTKEYTSQALINTKIAALKEVAKKYPRSLIRNEVKRINTSSSQELYDQFGVDELPFQKVSKETQDLFDKIMNTPSRVIDEKIKTCL